MPADDSFSLIRLRRTLGLAQPDMARRMGLSLRPYQQLELNSEKVRSRHVRLAESVALDVAIERRDPDLAPASVRKKAERLARVIIRRNFRRKANEILDIILDRRPTRRRR
jgi:hypothetical protein